MHLCGWRLYQVMVYWETAEENPSLSDPELEFARIWKDIPKIVFSTTLERVEGNARLVRDGVAGEVAKLKELGGGTPYFPALDERIDLELVEAQTFGSRVVYVRYRRV